MPVNSHFWKSLIISYFYEQNWLLCVPNFIALGIYFLFGTTFSWNEGNDTCFIVKCVLLGRNFDFLGGYYSLLLVPTFSMNANKMKVIWRIEIVSTVRVAVLHCVIVKSLIFSVVHIVCDIRRSNLIKAEITPQRKDDSHDRCLLDVCFTN